MRIIDVLRLRFRSLFRRESVERELDLEVPAAVGSILGAVRQEFDRIDKGFPVFNVRTLDTRIDDSLAAERMVANISASFGILALTLAAVGLYGVLAYSVSRRTREIGIRMALGSRHGMILAMVAREAGLLVGGSIAGVGFAVGVARVLSRILPPTASLSPALLAACAGTMLIITAVAACVPAIRGVPGRSFGRAAPRVIPPHDLHVTYWDQKLLIT